MMVWRNALSITVYFYPHSTLCALSRRGLVSLFSSFRLMDWNTLNQELVAIVESASVQFNVRHRGQRGFREWRRL